MAPVILVFAGERVRVSQEHADALVDYLWQGLLPGSATCAARLAGALRASRALESPLLEFPSYETDAIRGALAALGLLPESADREGRLRPS